MQKSDLHCLQEFADPFLELHVFAAFRIFELVSFHAVILDFRISELTNFPKSFLNFRISEFVATKALDIVWLLTLLHLLGGKFYGMCLVAVLFRLLSLLCGQFH
jgi:hypothetical protein